MVFQKMVSGLRCSLVVGTLLMSGNFSAQYLWKFSQDTVKKWVLKGGDEFNGTRVDTGKWFVGFPWGNALLTQDNYIMEKNFFLRDGRIDLTVTRLDSAIELRLYEIDSAHLRSRGIQLHEGYKHYFTYATALLWSKKQYTHGYFEMCFKGVEGQGIWPAFWLYGGAPNYEIDFFELKGEYPRRMHVNVHCPDGCANFKEGMFGYRRGWGHWVKLRGRLSDGYNVVGGEWEPGFIKWYLNGELVAYSRQNISVPMNVIAGTGVAKDGESFSPGANSKTTFPNHFSVDYIRVYGAVVPGETTERLSGLAFFHDSLHKTDSGDYALKRTNRLKYARKKTVDKDAVFVSLMPLSQGGYGIEVTGVSKKDPLIVSLFDDNQRTLKELRFDKQRSQVRIHDEGFSYIGIENRGRKIFAPIYNGGK